MEIFQKIATPLIAMAVFPGLWEFVIRVKDWPSHKLASPSDLPPALWHYRWFFLELGAGRRCGAPCLALALALRSFWAR